MKKWPWKIYGVFLTSILTHDLIAVFNQPSSFLTYYTILIGFNKFYLIALALNFIDMLINLICILVVFYYAFDIQNTSKWWKILFFARIFFDLTGNNYTVQFIKASFYQNLTYGLACLGVFIIPLIPSYIAHYLYISKKK